jgi:hypothetical protein
MPRAAGGTGLVFPTSKRFFSIPKELGNFA